MVPALSSPSIAARGESDPTPSSIPPAPNVSYTPQPWEQEREWQVAQSIEVHMDLIAAAKQHLNMLRDVDKWQCLYGGPALKRAIDRLLPPLHTYQHFYSSFRATGRKASFISIFALVFFSLLFVIIIFPIISINKYHIILNVMKAKSKAQ